MISGKFDDWLLYSVILLILIFGLWPKGFAVLNNVKWTKEEPGLRFGKYGIAYTDPFLHLDETDAVAIELGIKTEPPAGNGFSHILTLFDGDENAQLVIGQWRHFIIIMKGNDYENKKHLPVMDVDKGSQDYGEKNLLMNFDGPKARAVVNGRLAAEIEGYSFLNSNSPGLARIVLGNSPDARHPWVGKIYHLSLRRKIHSNSVEKDELYTFSLGHKHANVSGNNSAKLVELHIPKWFKVLKPHFFQAKLDKISWIVVRDIAINFFGFVPFGLAVAPPFRKAGNGRKWLLVLKVAVCGLFMSLIIESVQAWMPTRSSDFVDLVMNTAGSMAGACLYLNRTD